MFLHLRQMFHLKRGGPKENFKLDSGEGGTKRESKGDSTRCVLTMNSHRVIYQIMGL